MFLAFVTASAMAAPADSKVRWCVKSDAEMKKCTELAKTAEIVCVKREGSEECIRAIKVSLPYAYNGHVAYCELMCHVEFLSVL